MADEEQGIPELNVKYSNEKKPPVVETDEKIKKEFEKTKAKLEKNARQIFAISLFSDGVLSFGKAAELAGVNKWKFMDLLREKKITFYELTEEEILDEYKLIGKVAGGVKREGRK